MAIILTTSGSTYLGAAWRWNKAEVTREQAGEFALYVKCPSAISLGYHWMTERHLCGFKHCEQCAGNDDATDKGATPRQGSVIRKWEVHILRCSLLLPPGPSDDPETGHGRLPLFETDLLTWALEKGKSDTSSEHFHSVISFSSQNWRWCRRWFCSSPSPSPQIVALLFFVCHTALFPFLPCLTIIRIYLSTLPFEHLWGAWLLSLHL